MEIRISPNKLFHPKALEAYSELFSFHLSCTTQIWLRFISFPKNNRKLTDRQSLRNFAPFSERYCRSGQRIATAQCLAYSNCTRPDWMPRQCSAVDRRSRSCRCRAPQYVQSSERFDLEWTFLGTHCACTIRMIYISACCEELSGAWRRQCRDCCANPVDSCRAALDIRPSRRVPFWLYWCRACLCRWESCRDETRGKCVRCVNMEWSRVYRRTARCGNSVGI